MFTSDGIKKLLLLDDDAPDDPVGPIVKNFTDAVTAAGGNITGPQKTALTDLATSLMNDNLWDKIVFFYPFVGGSAAAHKFNFIDPRDLDAAFRLTFIGGIIHNANGITPNGVDGYGRTHMLMQNVPNLGEQTNSAGLGEAHAVYVRTSITNGNDIPIGMYNGGTPIAYFIRPRDGSNVMNATIGETAEQQGPVPDSKGFSLISRIYNGASYLFEQKNGVTIMTNGNDGSPAPLEMYIGALNFQGSPGFWSSHNIACAVCSYGLTETEATNLRTAVQAFQTALGRAV